MPLTPIKVTGWIHSSFLEPPQPSLLTILLWMLCWRDNESSSPQPRATSELQDKEHGLGARRSCFLLPQATHLPSLLTLPCGWFMPAIEQALPEHEDLLDKTGPADSMGLPTEGHPPWMPQYCPLEDRHWKTKDHLLCETYSESLS